MALAFIVVLIIPAILLLRGMMVEPSSPANSQALLYLSMSALTAEAIGLTAAVWIGMRRRRLSWADLGLRSISAAWAIGSVGLTFAASVIGGMAALLITQLLGEATAGSNVQAQSLAPAGFSWLGAIGMFVLGGLAVPFAEEFYFRGVLHRWASAKWGTMLGSLVSAFAFGLIHGIPAVIGFAFVMGIAIAYAYEKSRSLWPGIIIHVINNGAKIMLLYFLVANGFSP